MTTLTEAIEARLAFIAGCQAETCCNACRTMAADTLALLRAAAEPAAKCMRFALCDPESTDPERHDRGACPMASRSQR